MTEPSPATDTGGFAPALAEKLAELEAWLGAHAPVALGFSGGVDSTFLAEVCARTIPRQTLLVHLATPFVATPERAMFDALAKTYAARAVPVLCLTIDPLADPAVQANTPERCYWCKRAGFQRIASVARERGITCVLDGSNADDAQATDRPGMRALAELGVRSPLAEISWTKDEERAVLRAWDVPVWDLPAGACLATRIPCGTPLTPDAIAQARAAEDHLHQLGLAQVRARIAEGAVRIAAAPDDLERLVALGGTRASAGVEMPQSLVDELRAATGLAVEATARPYRRGAMNAASTR